MKMLLRLVGVMVLAAVVFSCSSSRNIGDRKLLSGEWLTIAPDDAPNVTIEENNKLFLLMSTEEESDTLRFNYKLKGKKLTLLMDEKVVSVSELKKLTADSLVYKRKRDNEVFSYKRKVK
ncbi:uncharacterized protein (TIGR03066 family) [Filimonas zeae]|uniref:Uncharacterized protein n=1 Tax=Filimonas zeae TaxID=1737353 RepID=A0A917J6I4_9BACT|nr:hypothetical protein [Filimonas zeae]MDR6342999.1 uncharacterized protein (TIGR03066 family) [Filimonas zeae]GGH83551.1 hypothetical protein GCM10011379_59110 [Filimonas zeae]